MTKKRAFSLLSTTVLLAILVILLPNFPTTNAGMKHDDYHDDPDKWSSTHHIHHPTMKPSKDRVREAATARLNKSRGSKPPPKSNKPKSSPKADDDKAKKEKEAQAKKKAEQEAGKKKAADAAKKAEEQAKKAKEKAEKEKRDERAREEKRQRYLEEKRKKEEMKDL